ncbi:MAG: hypothetical protein RLZZ557_661 [Bacteroidota bacterium]|jgi:hypothetical protein
MKSIKITVITLAVMALITNDELQAQDEFGKKMAEAKTAFAANKLSDARFAMQQMLQEIDILMGKSILKLLPGTLDNTAANAANERVTGGSGFVGVIVHKDYGLLKDEPLISVEVISNSPVLVGLNALLSMPILAGGDGRKVVKVAGYKALVEQNKDEVNPGGHNLQLVVGNVLIAITHKSATAEGIVKLAETIPVAEIAKLAQ